MVTFVSSIVAMIILSWQLTIVSVFTVPAFLRLTKTVGERRRRVSRSTQESLAAMSALTRRPCRCPGCCVRESGARYRAYRRESQRLSDFQVRQQMIGQGFFAVVQSFLVDHAGGDLPDRGVAACFMGTRLRPGTIVAFTTLQTRLYFPIGQLLQVSVELRSSLALFDRVFEYLDVTPDIVDAPDAVSLPDSDSDSGASAGAGASAVALRMCILQEPGVAAEALAGVSLSASPGQLVALVGPSGAGKTTISYLIPRLYDVTGGSVEIDGIDVRRVRAASLAAVIGFVTQESYLFHDTIWPTSGTGVPRRRWRRSSRRPGRRLFTSGSWSSLTGTTRWWASGGTLAVRAGEAAAGHRAGPAARSADPDPGRGDLGAGHGQRAAGTKGAGRADGVLRTTIAIAHRLSTIVNADVINVIDGGLVVESGSHQELLQQGGLYATLYQEQFDGGRVQWRCSDGDVMTDGTVRQREAQSA